MSNETIWKLATQVAAITGTGAIASNGFNGQGECGTVGTAQTQLYPLGDLALFASFTGSVSSASNVVNCYLRLLNIDSTNDSPQPQSAVPAYSNIYVGSFVIPPFTGASTGYFSLPDVPLGTGDMEFYIENRTNTGIASNYTLKLTPKTYAPAA